MKITLTIDVQAPDNVVIAPVVADALSRLATNPSFRRGAVGRMSEFAIQDGGVDGKITVDYDQPTPLKFHPAARGSGIPGDHR